uniref:Ankyrin repeat and SOCS box containing 2a, tandem duplicate 2 n=1 Tax=Xiphophorus maculatus TaxID=8083 RepID=A0A3B5PXR6_XIPMA
VRPGLCAAGGQTDKLRHSAHIAGFPPLPAASPTCENPNEEVVELLLRYGAQVNLSSSQGESPLHEACRHGGLMICRIVSLLIPLTSRVRIRTCGISPLHIAADRNRDEILELLIESGFDVNAELSEEHSQMYEDRRSTALYFSVSNGNLEAAETLLEAGANPNLDIFNPLLIAVRLGWTDMAELLVRYGADVNAQMSTQPSSFPSAILLGMESLPILKLLLDNGCDPCWDIFSEDGLCQEAEPEFIRPEPSDKI